MGVSGKKEQGIILFFILVVLLFMQMAYADVISLNSGGSQELIINPGGDVEGFFFGPEEFPEEDDSPSGGGGGGGSSNVNILVIPSQFNIDILINTEITRIIQIRNQGTSSVTVDVSQQNLQGRVSFSENSLTIPVGQTADLSVTFSALDEPGFYTGTIFIENEPVLVALNVHTEFLLFDSNIVVLNEGLEVLQRDKLTTLVTLIPIGDVEGGLDVTLNFAVKDFQNQLYLTKSETIFVDNQVELIRGFDIGLLPQGDYVIGLDLVYPNGVAPSSAYFKVLENLVTGLFGRLVLFLVIMILVVLILILSIVIYRKVKLKNQTI